MIVERVVGEGTTSRYHIKLIYDADRPYRTREDLVTKVLDHFGIPFSSEGQTDFYFKEPILNEVSKLDKYGEEYTLYSQYRSSSWPINGVGDVLHTLELLGVIPCSVDEAIKLAKGEKNDS